MAITNTEISQKISDLVDKWQLREDEMIDWLAGTVGGGPLSDGKYPLTDILGATVMVTCPAQMEQDVESLVGGAAGSAAAASASATAAALSEANAALSEAAASASAGAASASEAAAALSKTTAANHEANALFHANAADASATAAGLSETNAGASATAAAASFDSFDDRYLGSKATEPTTDNDGNALLVGALFWHTGVGFKGWNGSAWVAIPGVTAGAIANTPAGGISATDVQGAINELNTEKAPLVSPLFTRENTAAEGGQIRLAKAVDDTTAWTIDVYGTDASPALRFIAGGGVRASLMASGVLNTPDQPACIATRNTGLETLAANTSYGIAGAFIRNRGGFYAGSPVGGGGAALHVPATGYYLVCFNAFISAGYAGHIALMVNNSSSFGRIQPGNDAATGSRSYQGIIHVNAGDYINLQVGPSAIQVNSGYQLTQLTVIFLG